MEAWAGERLTSLSGSAKKVEGPVKFDHEMSSGLVFQVSKLNFEALGSNEEVLSCINRPSFNNIFQCLTQPSTRYSRSSVNAPVNARARCQDTMSLTGQSLHYLS